MTTQEFLAKLDKVKETGRDKWQCLCPAHDDRERSLSVTIGEDRKTVLHCHAKCTTQQIMEALGLKVNDLFEDKPLARETKKLTDTYDYTDQAGNLLCQSLRYLRPNGKKTFLQRRPNKAGGWVWNTKGVHLVIYRLPQVLEALENNAPIYIVEGEKDVATAEALGLCATTNVAGAGNWLKSYSEIFTDAKIVIIPDNDTAGREHAQTVARSLYEVTQTIKYLELPGLEEKDDLTDWVNAGGNRDALLTLAKNAPIWEPSTAPAEPIKIDTLDMSDIGNAERLIKEYNGEILFNRNTGKWLVWNKEYWQPDEDGEMVRRAIKMVKKWYSQIPLVEYAQRERLFKHALRSMQDARIFAIIRQAQHIEGVTRSDNDFDSQPYYLCVQNGVIDLQTGKKLSFDKGLMLSKQIPIHYDANAECPRWTEFLERVQPDPAICAYLQRAVGYSLTGDVSEHCLFFLHGSGRNGKSTFVETISQLVGDYYCKVRSETLMAKKQDGVANNDVAALTGKRMVSGSELSKYRRLDEGLVKDLTGGDRIKARFLYREQFEFHAGFKLWLYGNEKPKITGTDDGIWRRVRLIPWEVQIPEAQVNRHLREQFQLELPGILAWAVKGCLDWQRQGLGEPEEILAATAEYRRDQDPLADFFDACCEKGETFKIAKASLWARYEDWARITGDKLFDTQRKFNSQVQGIPGIRPATLTDGVKGWAGLRLSDTSENYRITENYQETEQLDESQSFMRPVSRKPGNFGNSVIPGFTPENPEMEEM